MNRVIRNKILVNYLIENGVAKNQRDLGAKMGYTNESAFSQVINEKVPTPKDFIAKLKTLLPTLNDDWLLYGEGTMLKTEAKMTPIGDDWVAPDDTAAIRSQRQIMRDYIEDADIIGMQSPMQCGDTRPLTAEDCKLCPEKIPFVRSEFVQARDVDIRELVTKESHRIEYRSMRDFIGYPDYAQKVITEAMVPDFLPGDVLFIQYLSDSAKVMSGAIYLVDTKLYGAMVRQVFVEQDHFVLHSKNPDYKELKLRKDDVYSFALVLHSLRSNFRISADMAGGAALYKKREEQLERLLDMNADAMAEICLQNERLAEERRRQDEERRAERERQDKLIERLLKVS